MADETKITRAPVYSLWTHKRSGRSVMADKNRRTAGGIAQVRIKHEGRAQWIDLDKLVENYEMDPES